MGWVLNVKIQILTEAVNEGVFPFPWTSFIDVVIDKLSVSMSSESGPALMSIEISRRTRCGVGKTMCWEKQRL